MSSTSTTSASLKQEKNKERAGPDMLPWSSLGYQGWADNTVVKAMAYTKYAIYLDQPSTEVKARRWPLEVAVKTQHLQTPEGPRGLALGPKRDPSLVRVDFNQVEEGSFPFLEVC